MVEEKFGIATSIASAMVAMAAVVPFTKKTVAPVVGLVVV